MKIFKMVSLLIIAVFSLSIASGASAADTELIVKENTTKVKVNQEFQVELKDDLTTGFFWHPIINTDYLTLVKVDSNQPVEQQITIGDQVISVIKQGGDYGKHTFTFKALKPGQTDLIMGYIRGDPNDQYYKPLAKKAVVYPVIITR